MNDLSRIDASGVQTMSSREIAELVEKRHDNVKRTIESLASAGLVRPQIEDEPETDVMGRARITKVYRVGKRDSYVIVAQLSPEFTARLVDRWQELETAASLALPRDYPSALRALADQAEIAQALIEQAKRDAPKIAFADQVAEAPDAIKLGQAAKLLGTGRNRLVSKLREIRWLTRSGEPYQDKIEAGYLDVKIGTWEHPSMGLQRSVTALVTGKGLAKLSVILADWLAKHGGKDK